MKLLEKKNPIYYYQVEVQTLESVTAEKWHIILVNKGNMTRNAKFQVKPNESKISKYLC